MKKTLLLFWAILPFTLNACGGGSSQNSDQNVQPSQNQITFTEVGDSFGASDLIDLEFLPGTNGEAIVIGKGGSVYYIKNDFTLISQTASISVENSGEQGLLNVVADPDYSNNKMVYFYYTEVGGARNLVERHTVTVDTAQNTFSLSDPQLIIEFPKSDSPAPGENHNGGGMVFDLQNYLNIGVGDGGGDASADQTVAVSQDTASRLGKIHRIIPGTTPGSGDFTIPSSQNVSVTYPSIYALGVRNPFTLALDEDGSLFIGDVGLDSYEEINCVYYAGENYGWPLVEGPNPTPGSPYRSPTHGFSHTDTTFSDEDPADNPDAGESIVLGEFYHDGGQYNGILDNKIIYSDFYQGWVRAVTTNDFDQVIADEHLGHLEGMTSLEQAPDGFLYATSLFGSDHILRLDLAP